MEEEKLPKPTSSQNNRRIAKNTMMLYFRMIIILLVGLFTSRVILDALGVEDYGIYTIVGGVVAMFGVFSRAMTSATHRFLAYEIGIGNFTQLKKTFNAIQIIYIGIAVLIFVLAESVGLWFVKQYLVIPDQRMDAAIWVYHFTVFSIIVSVFQIPYSASLIAHEKMNIYAYISIFEIMLKLLIVYVLHWIHVDKLAVYGILHFGVTITITIVYSLYVKTHYRESRFEIVKDISLYKTLIAYTGWTLFGNISEVAKNQGVNILLNLFFGPLVNAARGLADQVRAGVQGFVSNLQIAINPQIIKYYATDDISEMILLTIRSSRISYYLFLMISLPIILEINQILYIWLKIVPELTSTFIILSLIIVQIECLSYPLITAIQATGKIKTYQMIIGSMSFMILPISYFLLKSGFPAEIVLYANIVIEAIALVIRLLFLKNLINFPIKIYFIRTILKVILITILVTLLPIYISTLMEENVLRFFVIFISCLIWGSFIIFFLGFSKSEKYVFRNEVKRIIKLK